MTRLVTINGHKFVQGKSQCLDCDKPVKFTLSVEVALILSDTMLLCKKCYWEDLGLDKSVKLTLRELVL